MVTRTTTIYICEYCGREHNNIFTAKKCEDSHVQIGAVTPVYSQQPLTNKYPESIRVAFGSDTTKTYVLDEY